MGRLLPLAIALTDAVSAAHRQGIPSADPGSFPRWRS